MPLHLINIRDSVNQISVPLDYQILALNFETCMVFSVPVLNDGPVWFL